MSFKSDNECPLQVTSEYSDDSGDERRHKDVIWNKIGTRSVREAIVHNFYQISGVETVIDYI